MNWLEVSLTVSGEAAEAVADVFARFAPGGVVHEATQIEVTPDDKGRPVGPVIVRAYLPADEGLAAARAQLEEALWHLGQILPLPQPQYRPVAEADWSEAWKADFKPIRIGKRLIIVPAWLNPPLAPDDVPIRLDPGMAFGTGTHPTTQLCLAAIERHLQPGTPVIDLGTGSGILAIAAAKLGAGPLLAVDIDDEAVRVAKENAAANGVADHIHIEKGSLAEVLAHQFGMASAPFVVANILARVIVDLLGQGLAQAVTPGGLLVVSGILASQAFEVNAALKTRDLTILAHEHIEDWTAIIARR
ncbi:MAG TPA: 50S ribosomal protein L11 methyltransferase [Anaerolineales bacterium]|nr:50S ribosomal protein L11 methyltransferase [Anaerolineales bacterium]